MKTNAPLFLAAMFAWSGCQIFAQSTNIETPASPSFGSNSSAPPQLPSNASDAEIRKVLIEKRNREALEFSSGSGSLNSFQDLYKLNNALGDDDATYSLFQSIAKKNSSLAGDYEIVIEPLLVRRGEYQLCLRYLGNPESRFQSYCHSFSVMQSTGERFEEMSDQREKQIEKMNESFDETNRERGLPPMQRPMRFHSGRLQIRVAKTLFVGEVCRLIEILVGTGHQDEAEFIRGKAVALLDDPRLQSAVTQAEEHIKNPKTTPSAGEMETHSSPAFLAGVAPPPFASPQTPTNAPPAGINPATGLPINQRAGTNDPFRKLSDSIKARTDSALDKVDGWPFSEVSTLIREEKYEQALRRLQSLHSQKNRGSEIHLGRIVMLDVWHDLGLKYPPAMQALTAVRDGDVNKLSSGGGDAGLFSEAKIINGFLGRTNDSYALFKSIYQRDPQSAKRYYRMEEGDLIARGEYALCLKLFNPQEYLDSLHTNLDFMRKMVPQWRKIQAERQANTQKLLDEQRQHAEKMNREVQESEERSKAQLERSRQDSWTQMRTNMDLELWDVPTSPPPVYVAHVAYKPPVLPARATVLTPKKSATRPWQFVTIPGSNQLCSTRTTVSPDTHRWLHERVSRLHF